MTKKARLPEDLIVLTNFECRLLVNRANFNRPANVNYRIYSEFSGIGSNLLTKSTVDSISPFEPKPTKFVVRQTLFVMRCVRPRIGKTTTTANWIIGIRDALKWMTNEEKRYFSFSSHFMCSLCVFEYTVIYVLERYYVNETGEKAWSVRFVCCFVSSPNRVP